MAAVHVSKSRETNKIRIIGEEFLPLVFYWCETWSLMLTEENKLGVFENRVLRRIF
jgi:hypothetical protein